MTEGLLRVFETLGEKIAQDEGNLRWIKRQKEEAEKLQADLLEQNNRLVIALREANEKIAEYEYADDLTQEVQSITERGVAPVTEDAK